MTNLTEIIRKQDTSHQWINHFYKRLEAISSSQTYTELVDWVNLADMCLDKLKEKVYPDSFKILNRLYLEQVERSFYRVHDYWAVAMEEGE